MGLTRKEPVVIRANWTDQKDNLTEAFTATEVAVIAIPVKAQSYKMHEAVFTDYALEILQVLKGGPVPGDLKVTLTGGEWEGVAYRVEKQRMPDLGRPYLFLLQKRFPDDPGNIQYTPVGGYQGLIQLRREEAGGKVRWVAVPFNAENGIEAQVQGKDVLAFLGR